MIDADVPEFTARLKQLASAWPGRWFFDEGTPGAFWPALEKFDREDVWEALSKCTACFRDPPSAFQVAEVARLVAADRARREAIRNAPPVRGHLPAEAEAEENGDSRELGRHMAREWEQFQVAHRGQDRGKLFFAYLRKAGYLDAPAVAVPPRRPPK